MALWVSGMWKPSQGPQPTPKDVRRDTCLVEAQNPAPPPVHLNHSHFSSFHFIWRVVENNLSFQSAPLKQWCYIVCVVLICPVASCLWPPPGVTPIPLSPHTFISQTELLGINSSRMPLGMTPAHILLYKGGCLGLFDKFGWFSVSWCAITDKIHQQQLFEISTHKQAMQLNFPESLTIVFRLKSLLNICTGFNAPWRACRSSTLLCYISWSLGIEI